MFLILFLFFGLFKCDLPLHCVSSDIIGLWNFDLTKYLGEFEQRVLCGHDSPSKESTSWKSIDQDFKWEDSIEIELKKDHTVNSGGNQGKWSMIYDEGFELVINGKNYFAFNKYKPGKNGDWESICSETLIGWWIEENSGKKGCFKAGKKDVLKKVTNIVEKAKNQENIKNTLIFAESESHNHVVKQINSLQNLWEAEIPSIFSQMNFKEMNKFAGRTKKKVIKEKNLAIDLKHFSRVDLSDLPIEINFKSLIEKPIHQGECGSCYTVSTIKMYETRLKKKLNETIQLSAQNVLNCNYFNQGCNGGYPTLVNRFAKEFSLISEECETYKAKNYECNTNSNCKNKRKFKVTNYGIVGGFYGNSTEREMMIELNNGGPFVVSFEPSSDFMYYKKGIYFSTLNEWVKNNVSQPDWEKVDHSVLLVGYGEENGEKYWTLLNSWGDNWGENGFFRMRRGVDESGIESMAEFAYIEEVKTEDKKEKIFVEQENKLFKIKRKQKLRM